eukprot:g11479.t1
MAAYGDAVREVVPELYAKLQVTEGMLFRRQRNFSTEVLQGLLESGAATGRGDAQRHLQQQLNALRQARSLFADLRCELQQIIRKSRTAVDQLATLSMNTAPDPFEMRGQSALISLSAVRAYDYFFGNLNPSNVDGVPNLLHDARLKLEQLVAVVHSRNGGSKAADVLSCAAKSLQELDPWPHVHPTGVGTF